VATLATGWLLSMIGAAFGLTVADASDANDATEFRRLGLGVVAWMFFSWAAAFFIGGATTGRFLASDDLLGKVHGFTLWSLGTVMWIFVAALGATGLVTAGTIGATKVAGAGAQALATGGGIVAAAATRGGGAQDGGGDSLLGPLSRRIEAELRMSANEAMGQGAPQGAIEGLDGDTLAAAAAEIVAGRPETAVDVLRSRTNLTAEQAQAVAANVDNKVRHQIDEVQAKVEAAAQRAVDFAQAAFWALSAGAVIGLAACMVGGGLGARCALRHTSTWMRETVVVTATTTTEPPADVAIAH
jgi:hypothetical protein